MKATRKRPPPPTPCFSSQWRSASFPAQSRSPHFSHAPCSSDPSPLPCVCGPICLRFSVTCHVSLPLFTVALQSEWFVFLVFTNLKTFSFPLHFKVNFIKQTSQKMASYLYIDFMSKLHFKSILNLRSNVKQLTDSPTGICEPRAHYLFPCTRRGCSLPSDPTHTHHHALSPMLRVDFILTFVLQISISDQKYRFNPPHHGNTTAEDSYSLLSEEKYLKISFDAKTGFVFTAPREVTEGGRLTLYTADGFTHEERCKHQGEGRKGEGGEERRKRRRKAAAPPEAGRRVSAPLRAPQATLHSSHWPSA